MVKIAYCAGHGINTPGKRTPDGEREWSFNDKVAVAFAKELGKYQGVELLRTDDKTGKTDVALATRTNKANAWKADIYVSFHHNANTSKWGTWTGVEVFYAKGSTKGKQIAEVTLPAIVEAYGLKSRGLKTDNLHITRETNMPAILIEGGFMDSTIDIKKLRDDAVLANAGKKVAQAIAKLKGLKLKATETKPIENGAACGQTHVVVAGDTLYAIATKYKTTVDKIKTLNGLSDNVIKVGQKLFVS